MLLKILFQQALNNSMVKVTELSREIDKSVQTMDSELNQLLT